VCAYQIEEVPFACIFSEVSHLISVQVLKKVVQCSLITVNFTDRLQQNDIVPYLVAISFLIPENLYSGNTGVFRHDSILSTIIYRKTQKITIKAKFGHVREKAIEL
jgi:hypothetical protein